MTDIFFLGLPPPWSPLILFFWPVPLWSATTVHIWPGESRATASSAATSLLTVHIHPPKSILLNTFHLGDYRPTHSEQCYLLNIVRSSKGSAVKQKIPLSLRTVIDSEPVPHPDWAKASVQPGVLSLPHKTPPRWSLPTATHSSLQFATFWDSIGMNIRP